MFHLSMLQTHYQNSLEHKCPFTDGKISLEVPNGGGKGKPNFGKLG